MGRQVRRPGDDGLRWRPQPGPQMLFCQSPVFELVYGGARGGGKTDAALGEFALHAQRHGRHAKGLLVRRTRTALEPTIERAKAIYGPAGGRFEHQRSRFVFASGATLYMRHLDRDADAEAYQGHDYTRVYVEELTQFASPRPVDKLKATLRSAAGVRCAFRATCNPGGPGHGWVKAAYVDHPPGQVQRLAGGLTRAFIPARLHDNPALAMADPTYVQRLRLSGSEALVRAWLEGDWSVVEGAFFDKFGPANIVAPFVVPEHWPRIRAFDWGYASPFSVGWWAVAVEATRALSRAGPILLPRGALVRYREWYGAAADGGGLRLEAEAVAAGIVAREAGEAIQLAPADPSIFAQDGGPSIGERMARAGVRFGRGDNTRIAKAGALGGWDLMRARIAGTSEGPMLVVFESCADFIRTVPALPHDPQRPEDLDTNAEDHIADESRYACLARPWLPGQAVEAAPMDRWTRWRRTPQEGDWKVS